MNHVHPAFAPVQMTRRPSRKRTLLSAYHEPGHALPELYFGGHIVEVMIRSEYEATVCGSDYIDSEGFNNPGVGRGVCISQSIFDPELDVVGDCRWRMRAEMRMAVLVGGIYPLQRRFRWGGPCKPFGRVYATAGSTVKRRLITQSPSYRFTKCNGILEYFTCRFLWRQAMTFVASQTTALLRVWVSAAC